MKHDKNAGRKRSILKAVGWIALGIAYWINPIDLPTPADDLIFNLFAAYKTYKNLK